MNLFYQNQDKFIKFGAVALGLSIALTGCSTDNEDSEAPETYHFVSRFNDQSSVSYSGQVMRHLFISGISDYVGGELQKDLDDGVFDTGSKEDIVQAINAYYYFDDEISGASQPGIVSQINNSAAENLVTSLQASYNDVSTGKDLSGKIAGNDLVGQTKDWSGDFTGWGEKGSFTPENLVQAWVSAVADNAVKQLNGQTRTNDDGEVVSKVYLSEKGLDYQQLIQKFLLGAVAYSQATDDYLDNDLEGKGLNADNIAGDKGGAKPYTALEHAWDEGFGYYGAARDFLSYDHDHIAGKGDDAAFANQSHDSNGDGKIDLTAEHIFGHAANAGKRDRGADPAAPTDFSTEIFSAFVEGRHIISSAGGALSEKQMTALIRQRDIIVQGWEKVIAATVIHYINETIDDMDSKGSEEYSFADHAKHWSELKGFALSLQFNPFSQISDEDQLAIQLAIGDAPALDADNFDAYTSDLLSARATISASLGFADVNVSGW